MKKSHIAILILVVSVGGLSYLYNYYLKQDNDGKSAL